MAEAIDSQGNPIIRIQVGNPQGTEFEELKLPVDPKALFAILPRDLLERLKVPVKTTRTMQAPDGSRVPMQVGETIIRIGDTETPGIVVFGQDDMPTRIGDLTLKFAFLQLNPETLELEPVVLREVRHLTTSANPQVLPGTGRLTGGTRGARQGGHHDR